MTRQVPCPNCGQQMTVEVAVESVSLGAPFRNGERFVNVKFQEFSVKHNCTPQDAR